LKGKRGKLKKKKKLLYRGEQGKLRPSKEKKKVRKNVQGKGVACTGEEKKKGNQHGKKKRAQSPLGTQKGEG